MAGPTPPVTNGVNEECSISLICCCIVLFLAFMLTIQLREKLAAEREVCLLEGTKRLKTCTSKKALSEVPPQNTIGFDVQAAHHFVCFLLQDICSDDATATLIITRFHKKRGY